LPVVYADGYDAVVSEQDSRDEQGATLFEAKSIDGYHGWMSKVMVRDEMPKKVRFSVLQGNVCRFLSVYRSATFAA
jgi:hypothetical protein